MMRNYNIYESSVYKEKYVESYSRIFASIGDWLGINNFNLTAFKNSDKIEASFIGNEQGLFVRIFFYPEFNLHHLKNTMTNILTFHVAGYSTKEKQLQIRKYLINNFKNDNQKQFERGMIEYKATLEKFILGKPTIIISDQPIGGMSPEEYTFTGIPKSIWVTDEPSYDTYVNIEIDSDGNFEDRVIDRNLPDSVKVMKEGTTMWKKIMIMKRGGRFGL